MTTEMTISWLVRYGHILTAAAWLGGHAVLAFGLVPVLQRDRSVGLAQLAVGVARSLTYVAAATMFFGVFLITRTRGLRLMLTGEWGFLVTSCIVIAVLMAGIGDGPLRQGLVAIVDTGDGRAARRWALVGFGLACLAMLLMSRAAHYA